MKFLSKLSSTGAGSGAGWAARLTALAPTLVAVVLVIALAAQLATLAWRVLTPEPAVVASDGSAAGPVVGTSVTAIVNAHLFGNAAVLATGDAASAPTTNLNLILAGTLAESDPAQGWAIIGETAQAARVYATGATLPGGARLREVYADRVILERAGRLESLPLPRLAGAAATPVVYSQAPPPDSLSQGVRELIARDPSVITDFIRPQPVFAGGQQKGYRVYPGRNRSQFAALGLMPGDLVVAVNGAMLDDPNRGLEMLHGLTAGSPVNLTVERNGQMQQVTVDTAAVARELPDESESQQLPGPDATE